MWEIFNDGALPYASKSNKEVADEVMNGAVIPQMDCPNDIYAQIVEPCLQPKAEDRPSFVTLLKTLEEITGSNANVSTSISVPQESTIYQNNAEGYSQVRGTYYYEKK